MLPEKPLSSYFLSLRDEAESNIAVDLVEMARLHTEIHSACSAAPKGLADAIELINSQNLDSLKVSYDSSENEEYLEFFEELEKLSQITSRMDQCVRALLDARRWATLQDRMNLHMSEFEWNAAVSLLLACEEDVHELRDFVPLPETERRATIISSFKSKLISEIAPLAEKASDDTQLISLLAKLNDSTTYVKMALGRAPVLTNSENLSLVTSWLDNEAHLLERAGLDFRTRVPMHEALLKEYFRISKYSKPNGLSSFLCHLSTLGISSTSFLIPLVDVIVSFPLRNLLHHRSMVEDFFKFEKTGSTVIKKIGIDSETLKSELSSRLNHASSMIYKLRDTHYSVCGLLNRNALLSCIFEFLEFFVKFSYEEVLPTIRLGLSDFAALESYLSFDRKIHDLFQSVATSLDSLTGQTQQVIAADPLEISFQHMVEEKTPPMLPRKITNPTYTVNDKNYWQRECAALLEIMDHTLLDNLMAPIQSHLKNIFIDEKSRQNSTFQTGVPKTNIRLPTFSVSTSPAATAIGEYLLQLPYHLDYDHAPLALQCLSHALQCELVRLFLVKSSFWAVNSKNYSREIISNIYPALGEIFKGFPEPWHFESNLKSQIVSMRAQIISDISYIRNIFRSLECSIANEIIWLIEKNALFHENETPSLFPSTEIDSPLFSERKSTSSLRYWFAICPRGTNPQEWWLQYRLFVLEFTESNS